jgi:hypothetical protein
MNQAMIEYLLYMLIIQGIVYNLAISPEFYQPCLLKYSELM